MVSSTDNTSEVSENDLGLPIYPGAKTSSQQALNAQNHNGKENASKTVALSLTTNDSVEKVKKYYQDHLGTQAKITDYASKSGKLVDIALNAQNRQVRAQIVPQASGHGSVIFIITQTH